MPVLFSSLYLSQGQPVRSFEGNIDFEPLLSQVSNDDGRSQEVFSSHSQDRSIIVVISLACIKNRISSSCGSPRGTGRPFNGDWQEAVSIISTVTWCLREKMMWFVTKYDVAATLTAESGTGGAWICLRTFVPSWTLESESRSLFLSPSRPPLTDSEYSVPSPPTYLAERS